MDKAECAECAYYEANYQYCSIQELRTAPVNTCTEFAIKEEVRQDGY